MKRGLILILFLISGCGGDTSGDCVVAGCSNQLCVGAEEAKNLFTTCEYLEEYNCLTLTECDYFDGECKWRETTEYLECMEEFR